jgi:excisionase family DNA binding protein
MESANQRTPLGLLLGTDRKVDGMTPQPRMVDVKHAAEELGLSVACVRKWIAERRIQYVRLGRAIRVPCAEIERLISEGTIPARASK